MARREGFFGYDPLGWRLRVVFAAVCAVVVAAWAAAGLASTGGLVEAARLGVAFGLVAAAMTLRHRLRPRAGWGVTLSARGVAVARVLSGVSEVGWEQVERVRWADAARRALAVELGEGQRLLVPRALFAAQADLEALGEALGVE